MWPASQALMPNLATRLFFSRMIRTFPLESKKRWLSFYSEGVLSCSMSLNHRVKAQGLSTFSIEQDDNHWHFCSVWYGKGSTKSSKDHEGEASLARKQQKYFSVVDALYLGLLMEVHWGYPWVYLGTLASSGWQLSSTLWLVDSLPRVAITESPKPDGFQQHEFILRVLVSRSLKSRCRQSHGLSQALGENPSSPLSSSAGSQQSLASLGLQMHHCRLCLYLAHSHFLPVCLCLLQGHWSY